MLFLILNIASGTSALEWTHGERTISALPMKPGQIPSFVLMHFEQAFLMCSICATQAIWIAPSGQGGLRRGRESQGGALGSWRLPLRGKREQAMHLQIRRRPPSSAVVQMAISIQEVADCPCRAADARSIHAQTRGRPPLRLQRVDIPSLNPARWPGSRALRKSSCTAKAKLRVTCRSSMTM